MAFADDGRDQPQQGQEVALYRQTLLITGMKVVPTKPSLALQNVWYTDAR